MSARTALPCDEKVIYPQLFVTAMSVDPSPESSSDALMDRARRALAEGAWTDARAAFDQVLSHNDDPEALEGLGLAAWWLDLTAVVFESRERAFRRYRERGDERSAARVAVWLGWDYAAFRGEGAVARGWLGLARQLLAAHHNSADYAWLSIRECVVVLFEEGDVKALDNMRRRPSPLRSRPGLAISSCWAVRSMASLW